MARLCTFHKIVVTEPSKVTGGEIFCREASQKRRNKNIELHKQGRYIFCNIPAIFYIDRKL